MWKLVMVLALPLVLFACAWGSSSPRGDEGPYEASTEESLEAVSPMLARYREQGLLGEVWGRSDLSPRDRSLVTLTAMIARNQAESLPPYIEIAFDSGVAASEISEIVTHLAFYAGWGNALSASAVIQPIFSKHGIAPEDLPPEVVGESLPLDEDAEEQRQAFVEDEFGEVAPGVVHYTTEVLFLDLWLRPALTPRDRSLVTVSALIATGKVEQVPFHLNRALDSGLSRAQASEMLTHLAFYAGWPNVFSAMPVVRDVFESRSP